MKIAPVNKRSIEPLLDTIVKSIMWHADRKLYTPSIHGSRSAMMRRLAKTVIYWIQELSDHTSTVFYKDHVTENDMYGNSVHIGSLTFNNYGHRRSGQHTKNRVNGRVIIEVVPVLENYLQAGSVRRWFAKFLPKLLNTKSNKFNTTFTLKLRFWVDVFNYYEVDVYSLTVADVIIPPRAQKASVLKEKDDERYSRFSMYFRYGRGIRICEND